MNKTQLKVSLSSMDDNAARISARKMYYIAVKLVESKVRPKIFGLPSTPIFANFFDGVSVSKTLDMGCLEFDLDLFNQNVSKIKEILNTCKADIVREKEFIPKEKNRKSGMRILLDLKRIPG